ncbi:MAG: ABC transporter substrate-binding protein [bacterium]|nr:ABC transporter substrate-binding protein [bacterium]
MLQNHKKQLRDGVIIASSFGVLCLLLVCQSAIAQVRPSAEELIKENLAAVFAVLQTQDLDQKAKSQKIIDIVNPMFDFSLMAKLSLGRRYWPDLTPDQKERFTQLFINRLRTSYLDSLTLYTDEKVLYEPSVVVKNKIHIPTYLVSKEKKISILYKLYESESGWKVYDLEIQGVSIIRSYRSQFHEILKSGTIDDLMTKLEA